MSLTVEDGSVVANAESYATVTYADDYHLKRGNSDWAAFSTERKEQLLRLATDYMLQNYRGRWLGDRKTLTQRLDWPRVGVPIADALVVQIVNIDIVPIEVQNACVVLALKANSIELSPDLEPQTEQETVGKLSVTYAPGARQSIKFKAVDDMLAIYMRYSGEMVRG
jgi:hypothetical protein